MSDWSTEAAAVQRAADREARQSTHGPSISERIGEQIAEAWKVYLEHDEKYRDPDGAFKGTQIENIAEEFKPS